MEDQLTPSDKCALYLPEETKSISELESLDTRLPRNIKSESQMEMESKEKQKKIDSLMSLAEKVHTVSMLQTGYDTQFELVPI